MILVYVICLWLFLDVIVIDIYGVNIVFWGWIKLCVDFGSDYLYVFWGEFDGLIMENFFCFVKISLWFYDLNNIVNGKSGEL